MICCKASRTVHISLPPSRTPSVIHAARARFDEADALLPDAGPDLARAILHTDQAEIALAHGDTTTTRRELLLALPHVRQHKRRVRFWLVTLAGWLLAVR